MGANTNKKVIASCLMMYWVLNVASSRKKKGDDKGMIYDEIVLMIVLILMLVLFTALFCYYRSG